MELAKVRCPITGDVSRMSFGSSGDFDEYECPTCGRYRISGTMALRFSDMPKSDRLYCLAVAKTRSPAGAVPTIRIS